MVKGLMCYKGSNLSDPVIIRADSTMTYMMCSTIDDIDYNITHIIRGEDHVSNTAIQIQMFEAFGKLNPNFAHLSLIKAKSDKISKREGGFEICFLREKENLEPMAINSFFSKIGSINSVIPSYNMQDLVSTFDLSFYSKSPTTYLSQELSILNHKFIIKLEYTKVKETLALIGLAQIDENFWLAVRPNLQKISDIKYWWEICKNPKKVKALDHELLDIAVKNLPKIIDKDTWSSWIQDISLESNKKGRDLFMPLRLALTGMEKGPELKLLLPLINREEIIRRLEGV